MRLFIHATNVHQGGGRALLDALLSAIPQGQEAVLNLDERMPISQCLSGNIEIRRVKSTVMKRLLAEKWLANNVREADTVLCFGNLPPLFKLRARTILFLQNRYLIENASLGSFSWRIRLRLAMERMWLSAKIFNADEIIVQSPTMKKLAARKIEERIPIRILPFVASPNGYVRRLVSTRANRGKEFDFVYVATGEPHKNHRQLIAAWCMLADEGLFPSLCITLDRGRFSTLCRELEVVQRKHDIKLSNVGELSHVDVLALYKKAGALIFPSTFESFGIPLIEARQTGLPVLASELDYVRDVIDPEQSFDPESPRSIARAVKRFWQERQEELPLQDAHAFLQNILHT